jgi:hypothetical protein
MAGSSGGSCELSPKNKHSKWGEKKGGGGGGGGEAHIDKTLQMYDQK